MNLSFDFIYNLRLLRKTPGFVFICVLMIGLGMGLSITLYSITDNMGIKPLPIVDADKHVRIVGQDTSSESFRVRSFDGFLYQSLLATSKSFQTLGAFQESAAIVSHDDVSGRFQTALITPHLLEATQVLPVLGRNLRPSDDLPGADPVVLISYPVWQRIFAGSEDAIGTITRVNGKPYTIIGVMPENFAYPVWHEVWLPLRLAVSEQPEQTKWLTLLGVLDENIAVASASMEVALLINQLGKNNEEFYPNLGASVEPCCTLFSGDPNIVETLLPVLNLSLLLLVCLNVANLILVRTNQRIHEFAIRSAVGAMRQRLIISVLQDSLLITLLGSLLGLALATVGMVFVESALLSALSPQPKPFWFSFDWHLSTVLAALFVVVLIWLMSAALAIWQMTKQDLSATLAAGTSGATDSRSSLSTAALVSFELVFSCFLLICSGVLIGASVDTAKTDYGTATENYLSSRLFLPANTFSNNQSWQNYQQALSRELLAQEGIEAVSFASALPSQYGNAAYYTLEGQDLRVDNRYPYQGVVQVANNYFDTMEVSLRAGRGFDSADTANSLPVVIIDEWFALQRWPEAENPQQAALGKQIVLSPQSDSPQYLTIVGVVPHITQSMSSDDNSRRTTLYRPYSQTCCDQLNSNMADQNFSLVVKTQGDPNQYRRTLLQSASRVDRTVSLLAIAPLTSLLEQSNSVVLFATNMASSLAFIALALAITGIYAIISRSVRQRTKEIGVRRAIGSSNGKVLWVFVQQSLKYLGIGLLIGGSSATLLTNILDANMAGAIDWLPMVFTIVTVSLALLVFVATYQPASQLIAMEPGETLRDE